MSADKPRVSVVVFVRDDQPNIHRALDSLASQQRFAEVEVLLADGSTDRRFSELRSQYPWLRYLASPGGNMPRVKGEAIDAARGEVVAVLDSADVAAPGWIDEILAALADESVGAVGGTVVLGGPPSGANRAAYLFEYGAFNPPVSAGPTRGDLPGNNVAYPRRLLVEECSDILRAEGFNKPFFHERLRARGKTLILRPEMRVTHQTAHRFLAFSVRRFHYGRCFGATRWRRSGPRRRLLFSLFAPAVPLLLMFRQLAHAARHPGNRRLLPHAALALVGVCGFWGVGEWLGYWLGPGRSCAKLY